MARVFAAPPRPSPPTTKRPFLERETSFSSFGAHVHVMKHRAGVRRHRTADTARWRSQFSANTRETRRRFWSASGADF
jgi:hypothetical protein